MSESDAYESLPASTPLRISAFAGAMAGIAEHCLIYPIDSVKTRMQSLVCDKNHASIRTVLRNMVVEEGIFRPIRGMNAMAAGAGPAHAMYFTALEKVEHNLTHKTNVPEHMRGGFSAVVATLLHDAVMTPAEVVKQRLQMCCSPYSTVTSATMGILRTEGLHAFYRSYTTQLTMNIPFQAVIVTTYGICQKLMNPEGEYNPGVHFVSGIMGGSAACLVTMPFDVCKTLLNTQEAAVLNKIHRQEVKGIVGAARVVAQVKGFPGFFQGLTARVLYQAPSTAIAWSVYEFFKYYMRTSGMIDVHGDYKTVRDMKLAAPAPS